MWHEALEEASRLYFGEHNIEGMLKVLEPLHQMLEEGASTEKEQTFVQAYRHELQEAYGCCMKYKRTLKDAELNQSVSPELLECKKLELAVPGIYRTGSPVVTIASFASQLSVITSKQRPRKLTIHGSDGEDYTFLLKGHEDLRQDERVMQLFGLVNTLLENSRKTAEKDLSIQRYSVIPLSPNSGLIEWVPNCDTLHSLIREYRDARKITLNQEHKLMLAFAPDYDHLPLIAKVEVFQHALLNTEGNDLSRVLWLKSRTSEVWLDRRTNYTRSLAVMSMVGYLLGLGDRHPSNLMLHRYSGKILHIDFGDCFEASMNREKFPEKVPFRLTRMLVKAMEVSGIEGNFRSTCENVMQVLRTNKDSVMAMMEAFVHDPLINWRLFNFNEVPQMSNFTSTNAQPAVNSEEPAAVNREQLPQPQRGAREKELVQAVNQLGDANEVLNERAVVVMARMSNKLTGRDFSTASSASGTTSSIQHTVDHSTLISGDIREVEHGLSVKLQVQKLIIQARSHENLCQNYVGGWERFDSGIRQLQGKSHYDVKLLFILSFEEKVPIEFNPSKTLSIPFGAAEVGSSLIVEFDNFKTIDPSTVVPPNTVDSANESVSEGVNILTESAEGVNIPQGSKFETESAQAGLGAQPPLPNVCPDFDENILIFGGILKLHFVDIITIIVQEKLPIRVHHHQSMLYVTHTEIKGIPHMHSRRSTFSWAVQQFNREQGIPRKRLLTGVSDLWNAKVARKFSLKYEWVDCFSSQKWKEFVLKKADRGRMVREGPLVCTETYLEWFASVSWTTICPITVGLAADDSGIHQRRPASVNEHALNDQLQKLKEDKEKESEANINLREALKEKTNECDMLKETIEQMKAAIEIKCVVDEQCALEFADLPRQLDAKILECKNLEEKNTSLEAELRSKSGLENCNQSLSFELNKKCKEIETLKTVNTILMEQIDMQLPPATPLAVLQSHQPVPDTTLAKKYEDLLAAHEDIKKKLIAKEDFVMIWTSMYKKEAARYTEETNHLRQKLVNAEERMKSLEANNSEWHKKLVNLEERKKTLEVDNNEWVWRQALKKALASEGMGDMGDLTFEELFEQNERFFTIAQQEPKGDYQEDLVSTAVTLENVIIARREKMAKKKKMQKLLFQPWTKYLVDVRGVEISDNNSGFWVTSAIQH
ncbi:hypothetical protein GIB67_021611 [Kingdonia uniflora]|uniref:non-specific serine/threonine protein kinase n=1 Tax=Kingdonia uniflora TaxID=39325 RepID=A0A7J7MDN5_9MAGN|nr:hypothetical protein GIB67_021611 [Kingdonia uniflora]